MVGGVPRAVDLDDAGPGERPVPRRRSMPWSASQRSWPASVCFGDHEVAPGERRLDVDVGASPPLRAPRDRFAGRSSVFDGMQAQ